MNIPNFQCHGIIYSEVMRVESEGFYSANCSCCKSADRSNHSPDRKKKCPRKTAKKTLSRSFYEPKIRIYVDEELLFQKT